MEPTSIWEIGAQLVDAFKSGLGFLTTAPVSYMLVFGFIMAGVRFGRKIVIKR